MEFLDNKYAHKCFSYHIFDTILHPLNIINECSWNTLVTRLSLPPLSHTFGLKLLKVTELWKWKENCIFGRLSLTQFVNFVSDMYKIVGDGLPHIEEYF